MTRARTGRSNPVTSPQGGGTGELRDQFEKWRLNLEKRLRDLEKFTKVLDGAIIIDHGALAGLNDDDHPQYATNAEFDDHNTRHESGGADAIKLDDLATPDDNTDLNASTTRHGLLRKLDNVATNFLNGQGGWTVPAGTTDHGALTGLGDDDHPQYILELIGEFDFSAQADLDLTTGDHTFGGLTWTSNKAGATTWAIDNGAGLVYDADTTSTAFTSSSQTSSYIYVDLVDIYSVYGIDAGTPLVIEIYLSSISLENSNNILLGLWGISGTPSNSASRLVAIRRGHASGVAILGATKEASTSSNYTTDVDANTDLIGLACYGDSVDCLGGAGNSSYGPLTYHVAHYANDRTSGGYRDRGSRLVIAMPTGSTGGNMAVTVERMRLRRAA